MATTWDSASIADPESWDATRITIGAQTIMADGNTTTDEVAARWEISLTWRLITKAQRDAIYGKWNTSTESAAKTLTLPGGDSLSVFKLAGSWSQSPIGITPAWDVTCKVRATT